MIVPIALIVVFLILVGLLRAVVAPLVLIGTVVFSFAAALGLGAFFFEYVFDFPGMDPSAPSSCSSSWWRWGSTTTSS